MHSTTNVINLYAVLTLQTWLQNPNNVYVGRANAKIKKFAKVNSKVETYLNGVTQRKLANAPADEKQFCFMKNT